MSCTGLHTLILYFVSQKSVAPQCVESLQDRSLNNIFGLDGPTYAYYFALTVFLEAPIYAFVLRRSMTPGRLALWIVALNLLTHPLVGGLFPQFLALAGLPRFTALLVGETFAPLIEGLALWRLAQIPAKPAFGAALGANLFSWGIGALL